MDAKKFGHVTRYKIRQLINVSSSQTEPQTNNYEAVKAKKINALDLSGNCAFLIDSGGASIYATEALVGNARLSIWIMLFTAYEDYYHTTCQTPEVPNMPSAIKNYFTSSGGIA